MNLLSFLEEFSCHFLWQDGTVDSNAITQPPMENCGLLSLGCDQSVSLPGKARDTFGKMPDICEQIFQWETIRDT